MSITRPEPKTKRPDLPVVNNYLTGIRKHFEIDRIDLSSNITCEYCSQSQPDQWDGGSCFYCGAPIMNRGFRGMAKGISIDHEILDDGGWEDGEIVEGDHIIS